MQLRIEQACKDAGISMAALAEKIGVGKPTISNWEAGRRQPPLEALIQMSEITGVSVEYLLGISNQLRTITKPLPHESLPTMHRQPIWTAAHGWLLVNAAKRALVSLDGFEVSFSNLTEDVFIIPAAFALSLRAESAPLSRSDISDCESVWVEPISNDDLLQTELRGWYRPLRDTLVENEFGNRFYLDTYGVKWLAFESCFDNEL